ncbi:MAG TPA: hypothetical protein VKA21_10690 [Candidatus Binatia bacterium]|nr:hypothetical protein [Candidatus Binatia bacterium]
MRSRLVPILLAAAIAGAGPSAHAGAPASANREARLPHACKGGPQAGTSCVTDATCPAGACVVDAGGPAFDGVVTFIVDDNVSQFDGTESIPNVVAVTVLLEVAREDERASLAQTYQNLAGEDFATLVANLQAGPFVADTGNSNRRVTEASLDTATTPALLDDFLWQGGDTELAAALRAFFDATGDPIIVKASRLTRSDQGASGLASLIRLKIQGRFVAP